MLVRIGAVSEMTGVSVDVLRSWERRYGLLSPERTAGGFRLYTEADVARVRQMGELLAIGVSASEAARQVLAGAAPVAAEAETPLAHVRNELHAALRRLDEAAIETAIDRVLAGFGIDTAIRDVFLPALRDLGDDWAAGTVSVAQEHFAVVVLRGRLLALGRGWDGGLGPRTVLACPPGELHDVSLVMFGLALRSRGWRITFLGANTPVEDVFATRKRLGARLAVLFASNWDDHRALVPLLAAGAAAIALGGATAGPVARAAGCRWIEGDPVAAAEQVTSELAAERPGSPPATDTRRPGRAIGGSPPEHPR
jgi:DNA-binding transcriptional MerR regulator